MDALPEGNWKNYQIKIVDNQDISDISNFLTQEFHFDEPIGKMLSQDMEYVKVVNSKIEEKLKANENLSLIARDNTTGNVSGVQLVFRWTKEDAEFEKHTISNKNSNSSKPSVFLQRKVLDAIYAPIKDTQFSIFDTYGVSEVAWNFIVSTGKAYRNEGLASELQKRMVLLLKQENFKLILGLFSSQYSRRSAEKAGFRELSRSYYGKAKGENGYFVLPQARKAEDFVSLMVLKVN